MRKPKKILVNAINQSNRRLPRKFVQLWVDEVWRELQKRKVLNSNYLKKRELTLVFLDLSAAKKLNFTFRKKNYATDVLSFESSELDSLGELVLCPDVLRRQSREHQMRFRQELAYMVLHGILHLVGFEHENCSAVKAQKMFALQDDIFQMLSRFTTSK